MTAPDAHRFVTTLRQRLAAGEPLAPDDLDRLDHLLDQLGAVPGASRCDVLTADNRAMLVAGYTMLRDALAAAGLHLETVELAAPTRGRWGWTYRWDDGPRCGPYGQLADAVTLAIRRVRSVAGVLA